MITIHCSNSYTNGVSLKIPCGAVPTLLAMTEMTKCLRDDVKPAERGEGCRHCDSRGYCWPSDHPLSDQADLGSRKLQKAKAQVREDCGGIKVPFPRHRSQGCRCTGQLHQDLGDFLK